METWSLIIYVTVMMTVCPVKDGHPDFWPAEIFGRPTVKAGENMQLNCIDFGKRGSNKQLHLYLLKNGAGVIMELLRERHEHIFTVINVSVLDSGNYSCVFSLTKYPLKNLNASALKPGQKTIQVQVTDNSSPITDKHPQQNIQHSAYPKNLLITLLVLLLVVILFVGMYRNRAKMFTEFCHKQGQSYAESGVYSLAQGSVVYSLAEHPDVKIDSEQPSSDAVYAKVQKKKKKITHDEFFIYE
ncbi:hypothetical protein AOLI_G00093910 [Acnodon oligacanthus]